MGHGDLVRLEALGVADEALGGQGQPDGRLAARLVLEQILLVRGLLLLLDEGQKRLGGLEGLIGVANMQSRVG